MWLNIANFITLPYYPSSYSFLQLIKETENETKHLVDKHRSCGDGAKRGFESLSNHNMWLKLACYDYNYNCCFNLLDFFLSLGTHIFSHSFTCHFNFQSSSWGIFLIFDHCWFSLAASYDFGMRRPLKRHAAGLLAVRCVVRWTLMM